MFTLYCVHLDLLSQFRFRNRNSIGSLIVSLIIFHNIIQVCIKSQVKLVNYSKSSLVKYNSSLQLFISPLYLRQELRLEDAPGLQRLGDLSPEEEATLGEIDQDLPDDLSQVHTAAHLLIPEHTTES